MENLDVQIMQWFSQYIYKPELVYMGVVLMMLAGSFGVPIPEEAALISVGLVAYMGSRPDLYPPPYPGAPHVDGYVAAVVSFFAVLGSDLLVYLLGRFAGKKLVHNKKFNRLIKPEMMDKIQSWTQKYGIWASGIFRFTPALRFPGFLSCGFLGIPLWKFLAIDGTAALLSVPTQVILVYLYGETILIYFKKFKIVIFSILGAVVLILLIKKLISMYKKRKNLSVPPADAP